MTPSQLRRIRQRLGLTQGALARRLGVHPVTVRKWEAGMQPIRGTHAMLIRLIAEKGRRRR